MTVLALTFDLPPGAATRLRRHPAITPLRAGAGRAVTIAWHDTAAGTLAAQGLSLVSARRVWRLERAQPGTEPWPPATLPPGLAEADNLAGLGLGLGNLPGLAEPPMTFARLRGRETWFTSGVEADALEVCVLRGTIRAGSGVAPICRVTLTGPEAAIVALALALAEDLDLRPPRASLAAEAIALAAGTVPPSRRTGTSILAHGQSVGAAFPLVIAHLTDVMLAWARSIGPAGENPEPVHQMRVAMRRMRSAVSIFRDACASPSVLAASAGLRALGQVLGPARDWDVFLTGLGQRVTTALPDEPTLRRLLRDAEQERAKAYAQLATHLASAEFRRLCIALVALGAGSGWLKGLSDEQRALLDQPLDAFAATILARRHRRVKRRGDHFRSLDIPALHAVRLAAKRLRYAAEFFVSLFDAKAAARFVRRLARLQDQLGHLNDGAVAASLLAHLNNAGAARRYAIGLVRGFVAAESVHARDSLDDDWKRFRRLDPFWR